MSKTGTKGRQPTTRVKKTARPMKTTPGLKFIPDCKLSNLRQYDRNPRLNDPAVEAVSKSIAAFGFISPIIVDEDFCICAGDTRFKAATRLGLETIPVVMVPGLQGDKFAGFNIADNRTAQIATWNEDELAKIIGELQKQEFDIESLGFSDVEMSALLDSLNSNMEEQADPDEVPDPPKKAITKPGDLWLLGNHRLLCGDSTKGDDVKRLMNGQRAIMMATDPPYGVNLSKTKNGLPGFKTKHWGDIKNDTLEGAAIQPFLESCFHAAEEFALEKNAAWYLWHAHITGAFFAAAAAAAADILLHRQIIWHKPKFVLTRSGMYHWQHEPCFYGWKRGHMPPWYGDKSQSSVWEVGRDADKGQHPTQKPIELFTIPMENHTLIGGLVYEPFSGSGSQVIAAETLDRKCYAMEIEPRYCDVAVSRWENYTGRKAKRA